MHFKPGETGRPRHYHLVFPRTKSSGAVVKDSFFKVKNERISLELEYDFGHPLRPGPNIVAVREFLNIARPDMAAAIADLQPPPKKNEHTTAADKNFAHDCHVELEDFDARVLDAWRSDAFRNPAAFARFGLTVAGGDKAVMIVDLMTGFSQSLCRVVNRRSKKLGQPLALKERDVRAIFADRPPLRPLDVVTREVVHTSAHLMRNIARQAAAIERSVCGATFDGRGQDFLRETPPQQASTKTRNAGDEEPVEFAAVTTLKRARELIWMRHNEIADSRKRAAEKAWRSARIWRSRHLEDFVFMAGAGAALACGTGLLMSVAAGALATKLVVERGRMKLLQAQAASAAIKTSRREVRNELDQYFAEVRLGRQVRLSEIPRHVRVAVGHVFIRTERGATPRTDVVATLDEVCPGLSAKIGAVARHSTSPQLRAVLRSMVPENRDRQEKALRIFVDRKGRTKEDKILRKQRQRARRSIGLGH
jgi:hypothetical protein